MPKTRAGQADSEAEVKPASGKPARDPWDTPAMRQFTAFKKQHPDAMLFFRMGDFYELFGEDAVKAGEVLGLTVTERTKGIAMAGAPHHQLSTYLRRSVEAGLRVAVVDQVQDPAEAKGVVDRAVTRVVTPGTLVDEDLLEGDRPGSLLAVVQTEKETFHAAACQLSTGALELLTCSGESIRDEIASRDVREVVCPATADDEPPAAIADLVRTGELALTARPGWRFAPDTALDEVKKQFGVKTAEGFGVRDDDPAIAAVGGLIAYLRETQAVGEAPVPGSPARTLAHLRPPLRESEDGVCRLDAVALRALEIERVLRSEDSSAAGSLVGVFLHPPGGVRCPVRTAMGKRLLRQWLCRPLSGAEAIAARHAAVETLVEDERLAGEIDELLSMIQDVERIGARVALARATPRDLVGLARSLSTAPDLAEAIGSSPALSGVCGSLVEIADDAASIAERVLGVCVDHPPASLAKGGLIRDGIDAELDEARRLKEDAGQWLADYQTRLIEAHDLPSLKVGYNKVFGYYIELPSAQARRAPDDLTRKQTLKNAERFTTPELRTFEQDVTTAESRALEREKAIFHELLAEAGERHGVIRAFADVVARLDVVSAFAATALRRGWARPEVTDEPVLEIVDGRHPVLDELLGADFVPNGAGLGDGSPALALITGPNMAGKSTYIRQCALLTVLASAGSFVPAAGARIGTCDRIFTRVGADDALHRGRSTFMVEMTETATMLHNAGRRSLVVLDEIGRGTSTLDGLSLAWAIAESLAETGCRTLFATHYHELTELESRMTGRVRNLHVAVKEWQDEIVFVHEIRAGRAKGSYGVHVARLAGMPRSVTERARELLETLSVEQAGLADAAKSVKAKAEPQMSLFTAYLEHPVVDELRGVELETLSPLEAFDLIRGLVERARERGERS
ncbi:MAG: DNA mismatch repair protein MutS [Planctomycetota bacterium]